MCKIKCIFTRKMLFMCLFYDKKNAPDEAEDQNIDKYKQICIPSDIISKATNALTQTFQCVLQCNQLHMQLTEQSIVLLLRSFAFTYIYGLHFTRQEILPLKKYRFAAVHVNDMIPASSLNSGASTLKPIN